MAMVGEVIDNTKLLPQPEFVDWTENLGQFDEIVVVCVEMTNRSELEK